MTRIDFYVLPDVDRAAQLRFCCRLAERARSQGHRVYVHLEGAEHASELDELMWQYPADSFLPHGVAGADAAREAPIVLGFGPLVAPTVADAADASDDDVLINLTDSVPEFFSRFARVAEIVVQEPRARAASRERFRFYRERGYPLHHHEMKDWRE